MLRACVWKGIRRVNESLCVFDGKRWRGLKGGWVGVVMRRTKGTYDREIYVGMHRREL